MKKPSSYNLFCYGFAFLILFALVGCSGSGGSSYAPAAPTGVAASDNEFPFRIQVTWNEVAGAAYYRVYRADAPGGRYELVSEGEVTGTSFDDTSPALVEQQRYYYKVRAVSAKGIAGRFSAYDEGYTARYIPPAPAGVTASNGVYSHTILITWDPVEHADYYRVYRSATADGTYAQLDGDIRAGTGDTYNDVDPAVPVNTVYYYRVRAFTDEGAESEYSVPVAGSKSSEGSGVTEPTIVEGSPLLGGTYAWTTEDGTTTYVFSTNGRVRKTGPYRPFLDQDGSYTSEGTWSYTGAQLTISTSFNPAPFVTARIVEVYNAAYTIQNGATLFLGNAARVEANQQTLTGDYEGTLNLGLDVRSPLGSDTQEFRLLAQAHILDDGTWNGSVSLIEGSGFGPLTQSGVWDPATDNWLVRFQGAYYPPLFADGSNRIMVYQRQQ